MQAGPYSNDASNIDAARQYDILDTPPEREFDDIAVLAAHVCKTPIALISLTDGDREWFKARVGIPLSEVPRHLSFCVHMRSEDDIMVVPDTLEDERFATSSFVTQEPGVRFYAGTPLLTPEGLAIGSLCVADVAPRELDEGQQDAMRRLGRQIVTLLEARPLTEEEKGRSRQARLEVLRERQAQEEEQARQDAERLKASEERYRRLFETAKDGVLILDVTSGAIEDVNPFLCDLLEYEPTDFLGRQLWEIGIFSDEAENAQAFQELQAKEYARYDDLPVKTKTGRSLTVGIIGNVYTSAGQRVIQLNIRDVTAEKRAIMERERFFRLSLDMLCIIDINGRFKSINSAFARLLGAKAENLVGRSSFDFLHPDDFEPSGRALGMLAMGHPLVNFVNRFRAWDGSYKNILWDASAYGDTFYAAGRDITERLQSEAAMEQSRRFLQSTLDSLSSHIAVLDDKGEIVAINQAWLEFAAQNGGTAASCGVGANYLEICAGAEGPWAEGAHELMQGIREVMEGKQQSFCLEYPCHSSEERWFTLCVTRFAGEGPFHLVIAHEDITERKQAENRIRTSESILARSQQIAQLGSWEFELPNPELSNSDLSNSDLSNSDLSNSDLSNSDLSNSDLSNSDDLSSSATRWSDEVFRILGYEPGEIEASYERFLQAVPAEDRDRVLAALEATNTRGEPYDIEHRLLLADGTEKFVHAEAQTIYDDTGKALRIVGTVQDITERKRAEAARRDSEIRYRALAEASPDDIFIVDREGVLQYINQHGALRFALPPQEMIGKSREELFPDELAQLFEAGNRQVFESGAARYEELSFHFGEREFSQSLWLVPLRNGEGEVVEVMGVGRDISNQKRAEETLRASEARYRSLFESNPHPMWVYDVESLRFLEVNEAAIAHYGFSRDEFLRMTIKDIRPDEETAKLEDIVEGDLPLIGKMGIWKHRKKDGTPIDVEITTHEFSIYDRPARLILALDVTARLAAERDLNRANEELERRVGERTAELGAANESLRIENIQHQVTLGTLRQAAVAFQQAKEEADLANAAKSAFLSRMSHELRTPLNAILGFGQILQKQNLSPLGQESVGYILKGGSHLLTLINEVLDIARLESGRLNLSLEPISLADVVSDVCTLMNPLAAERSIVLTENSAQLERDYIMADRQRLKQVLINLLANAIKYNREGGRAEVICTAREDGWTSIAVRDTGMGISSEDMPKLFTPFERLSAAATDVEGSGLGLVLSQRLIMAMGGTLKVESTLGQGTTLTMEFPQAGAPEDQLASVPESAPLPTNGESYEQIHSVLCIEDNPSNLRLIEVILHGRRNIQLTSAMDGITGLEMARQNPPDLILLDLNLPDINGKEVLGRLQQSDLTRGVPVVIISADATPNQVDRLIAAGAKAYLTKPLNISLFLSTTESILAGTYTREES
jgi:PAS domain S-box-containing protein